VESKATNRHDECYELLREESKHIGQHDACNDRNVTRAIFDEARSKRAEKILQEWIFSQRPYPIHGYPTMISESILHPLRGEPIVNHDSKWLNYYIYNYFRKA
jgi:hypothetical protein